MAHGLDQRLLAVTAVVGAPDTVAPARNCSVAAAVERGAFGNLALLQRRRQRNGLEGGARLIGGVDALIAPLALHGAVDGLGPGISIRLLRFIGRAVGVNLLQIRVQLFLQRRVKNRAVIVQVIVGIGRHGDDGAGIDIHDDAGAAVLGVILFQHILQPVFKAELHVGIQRQHKAVAVLSIVILLVVVKELRPRSVSGADGIARRAGEGIIIFYLKAHAADTIAVDKAYHAGGQ